MLVWTSFSFGILHQSLGSHSSIQNFQLSPGSFDYFFILLELDLRVEIRRVFQEQEAVTDKFLIRKTLITKKKAENRSFEQTVMFSVLITTFFSPFFYNNQQCNTATTTLDNRRILLNILKHTRTAGSSHTEAYPAGFGTLPRGTKLFHLYPFGRPGLGSSFFYESDQ